MIKNTDLLSQLNAQQKAAVEHTDGPILILAGAGSGKTRTITYKIAYLISEGIVAPERILAVTFTNKAAEEMRSRVETLLKGLSSSPLICTFHSFGARLLRRHARRIGYGPDFTICDTDDQKRVFKQIFKKLSVDDEVLPLDKARSVISSSKNRGQDAEGYLANSRDFDAEQIFEVFSAYQEYLKTSNAVDFDDLILQTVRLLEENEDLCKRYSEYYQHLLIDEYQDTNPPQYELVRLLTSCHQNVSAVGDEDQSIYGFRGADISNILRFESDFQGARVVKLEQNYRSTQNILDAATAVVSNNIERKHKVLWTESSGGELVSLLAASDARAEATFIANRIREYLRTGDSGIAVLYRTNFQSRQFEESLARLGISYRLVGGVSFYHRKEVRDALAYLRVARNPDDDVSLTRILNQPPRGIGGITQDRLFQIVAEQRSTLWSAIQFALANQLLPGRAHLALERFTLLVKECREAMQLPLFLALEKILDKSGYLQALDNGSEDNTSRAMNLQELVTVARDYENEENAVQEFLDQAALHADVDEFDESADVTLMTLHNAKGLEFPIVFLAGCEEGLFPHSRSIAENELEEERRLCYVGLTRAQQKLYLSYSRRRRFFGRESDEINRPSRFLHEIPQHLIQNLTASPTYSGPSTPSWPATLDFQALQTPERPKKRYSGKTYNSVDSIRTALKSKPSKSQHSTFKSGALIVHRKFGKGRVLRVEETGSDLKITVQFPGIGIKKMLQSYAKLKLV